MKDSFETIENLGLIENALVHLEFELQRKSPSFFRVAREAHQILYRAMIEVLQGTDCFQILKPKGKRGKPHCKYSFDDGVWMEVVEEPVKGCNKAWRFSNPRPSTPPQQEPKQRTPRTDEEHKNEWDAYWDQDLIAFYSALAKIQTERFMRQYVHSTWERIDDEEMEILEWVHEQVRNEFEHFVPRTYDVEKCLAVRGAELCLKIAGRLLFESNNVLFDSRNHSERIRKALKRSAARLQ